MIPPDRQTSPVSALQTGKHTDIVTTYCYCDQILTQNIQNDKIFIPTTENTFDVATSIRHEIPKAKQTTKQSIQEFTLEQWNSKVEKLIMQGDFAKLLIEEKDNIT